MKRQLLFSNLVVRCGGRRIILLSYDWVSAFSELVPLDCGLYKCFSDVSPLLEVGQGGQSELEVGIPLPQLS